MCPELGRSAPLLDLPVRRFIFWRLRVPAVPRGLSTIARSKYAPGTWKGGGRRHERQYLRWPRVFRFGCLPPSFRVRDGTSGCWAVILLTADSARTCCNFQSSCDRAGSIGVGSERGRPVQQYVDQEGGNVRFLIVVGGRLLVFGFHR